MKLSSFHLIPDMFVGICLRMSDEERFERYRLERMAAAERRDTPGHRQNRVECEQLFTVDVITTMTREVRVTHCSVCVTWTDVL